MRNGFHVLHKLEQPHLASLLPPQEHGCRSESLPRAFYFPLSRAGVTHQNVPPPGGEQLRGPAAKPLLAYQSICTPTPPPPHSHPTCSSPFKQCKAIFWQHRCFFKGGAGAGGMHYRRIPSPMLEQHLGGHSRFLSGSALPGGETPALEH